jgi:uncharacterized membrane protein
LHAWGIGEDEFRAFSAATEVRVITPGSSAGESLRLLSSLERRLARWDTGGMMRANLHLLFWLSLFPAITAWVGEYPESPWPTALYGVVLLIAALAWLVLQRSIIRSGGTLAQMIGSDLKGKISPLLYLAGIGLAFFYTYASDALYAIVAALWIIPDRRIEAKLVEGE